MGIAFTAGILSIGAESLDKEIQQAVLLDGMVCAAVFLLLQVRRKYLSLVLTFTVIAITAFFSICQIKSKLVTKEQIKELDNPQITAQIEKYQKEAGNNYRIETRGSGQFERNSENLIRCDGQKVTTGYSSFYNADYQKFRSDLGLSKITRNILMQDMVDNPLFLRFMGVKYLVGRDGVPEYKRVEKKQSVSVCQNDHVAPIAYLTNQTVTRQQFQKLNWAQKQLLLQQFAVAGKIQKDAELNIQKVQAAFLLPQDKKGADEQIGRHLFFERNKRTDHFGQTGRKGYVSFFIF